MEWKKTLIVGLIVLAVGIAIGYWLTKEGRI
jgi:uncharacterized membrane protein